MEEKIEVTVDIEVLKNEYRKLFNESDDTADKNHIENLIKKHEIIRELYAETVFDCTISDEEMQKLIKALKNGKAKGIYEICNEQLKY